jgi:hypothetical protein
MCSSDRAVAVFLDIALRNFTTTTKTVRGSSRDGFSHPISHRTPHYRVGNGVTELSVARQESIIFQNKTRLDLTVRNGRQGFRKPLHHQTLTEINRSKLAPTFLLTTSHSTRETGACPSTPPGREERRGRFKQCLHTGEQPLARARNARQSRVLNNARTLDGGLIVCTPLFQYCRTFLRRPALFLRDSSRATALRTKSVRSSSFSSTAAIRANVPSGNRACISSFQRFFRPTWLTCIRHEFFAKSD